MIPPVIIDLIVKGTPQIHQSIRNVTTTLARAEQQATRDAERGARARTTAAERAARAQERAVETSARASARIHSQATREVERIQERAHRNAVKQIQLETRERERASSQWVRMREREIDSVERANRRMANAMIGAGGRGVAAGARRVGSIAMGMANTVAQLGGGFSIAGSVTQASRMSGLAADIANSAWIPNGKNEANRRKRSTQDVLSPARAAAIQYGLETETTLGGLQKFVGKTGDLDTGLQLLPQLAQLSRATGASFQDVADAAGDVVGQLGDIPNKGEAVMAVMRGIAGQGKLGAVEMRDLASQMAKLAASAGQFGGDAVDNILKMGMLAQEARAGGGASSATMAATSVAGFTNTLKTPARLAHFKQLGIDVFDPKTKMLNAPEQIITQSLEKTKGDPLQMKQLFMNVMGERAVTGYANIYRKAEAEKPGSGTGAVRAEMDRMLKGATMSKADVARAASDRMKEADARMAQIRERFDEEVANRLLPKLIELAPAFEKLLPQIVDLAARGVPAFAGLIQAVTDFAQANKDIIAGFAAHPIVTILAAEVVKSVGQAAIGEAVKRAILAAIPGGGGGGPGPGGKPGVVAPALGTGLAAGFVITKAELGTAEGEEHAADVAAKVRAWKRGVREPGRFMTPEQAQAEIGAQQAYLDKQSVFEQAANLATSPFVDASDRDYKQFKAAQGFTESKDLQTALQEATAALRDNSAATRASTSQPGGGSSGPNGSGRNVPISER